MESMYIISWVLLSIIVAYYAYRIAKAVWNCFDHSKVPKNALLRQDAKIVDVSSEKVQYVKNGAKYKTTVSFSDGFVFITHKTNREDNLFTYQISVDTDEILESAIKAHDRAIKKQK